MPCQDDHPELADGVTCFDTIATMWHCSSLQPPLLSSLVISRIAAGVQVTQQALSSSPSYLASARDLAQTGFYLVVGVVTVLTYRKAKLTLLQPLRTEVFKQQIATFTELLSLVRHPEFELREQFGFGEMVHANITQMYDAYARHFFDVTVPEDERPYGRKNSPGAIFLANSDGKCNAIEIDVSYVRQDNQKSNELPDPRTRAALWAHYQHNPIALSTGFSKSKDQLSRIADSPLITKELADKIGDLQMTISKDVHRLSEILTEAAKEMPEKYPTLAALQKGSFGWISSRYNSGFTALGPKSKAISDYMRRYFKVDKLME